MFGPLVSPTLLFWWVCPSIVRWISSILFGENIGKHGFSESVQKGTNLILAKAATCGHLLWRPLAATCGHLLWRPLAATCGHSLWRPLAATCGHLLWRPLAATRLAASGCKWLPMKRECRRPLAATQVAASGCKWLQVAASGCKRLPGVGEIIFFTIHPLLGGEYWEFSVACARKIYNILRGRSLGNVKYCTVIISMLREFLLSEARPK